jgi:hypothetical protein
MFLAVIVITNSYLNYSWKNWIGIIFHLFTTVCKYGVSTLQYTTKHGGNTLQVSDGFLIKVRLGHLWTLALRHYIHLYFFLDTTYFGVVSSVFLVLD